MQPQECEVEAQIRLEVGAEVAALRAVDDLLRQRRERFELLGGEAPGEFLDGQYTIVGNVISGMEVVDAIKRGDGANGEVSETPDVMTKVSVQN